jgi:hypothetical protein
MVHLFVPKQREIDLYKEINKIIFGCFLLIEGKWLVMSGYSHHYSLPFESREHPPFRSGSVTHTSKPVG